ncbi:DUF11 domain-containing protein [Saccharothrix sp. SC076]|nr:DUF11 domain-containing protein [Saccharothrix obliqua]
MALFARGRRGLALVAALVVTLVVTPEAVAQAWAVEGERDPSAFDCDHLYYSNFRSGMEFVNGPDGTPTIANTVITKRVGSGLPDYWSASMALGRDPDSGDVTAFYANYTGSDRRLYKHVSGTNSVTDEIAGGRQRLLPAGADWGGLAADPDRGALYGAQNGGAPKLFRMDLATGTTDVWTRGDNLTSVPPDDPVFTGGSIVPDMFVDESGGAYYGIAHGGASYIYRLDPATGTTRQAVRVTGPASGNGFNNYGMAYAHNAIYLGAYWGALYRVDPATGESVQVAGGNVQDNQVGRVQPEPGGSWPITDLAACWVAPDLTRKVEVAKTADRQDARPGDKVTYTVTVRNTGTGPATGVPLTDDLSGVLDDAAYNDDAAVTGSDARPAFDGRRLTWTGDVAAGAIVTITYSVTVGTPPAGDKNLRNSVTVPDSGCAGGCVTDVPVAVLRLKKVADPAEPKPGGKTTYTITATNDGKAAWRGATITDDLTGVVDDAAYGGDVAASTGTAAYDPATRKITWTGDVAAGASVTITFSATAGSPPAGDKRLVNVVVGPNGSNCPEGSTAADCRTDQPIKGLVIHKAAEPATARPGDTVGYAITVRNVGGVAYSGAAVTDDLTGVLDDADYGDDASATAGRVSFEAGAKKLTWTGDVGVDQTVTINFTVKVKSPPAGDSSLKNVVTGPDDSTCPAASPCGTETPVGAITVRKVADKAEAVAGDRVTYTVTVTNTGGSDYPGASFTDDLTGVLDDASWDDRVTAERGVAAFDAGTRRLTWTGDVAAGAAVLVTYSVTVGSPPAGDKVLRNAVEGAGCRTPALFTRVGADAACGAETPIRSLTIGKSASPGPAVAPGDVVQYEFTVHNTGAVPYDEAVVTDDLSDVGDDARYNGDAAADSGLLALSGTTLRWRGRLAPGESVAVTYSVRVHDDATGTLRNVVVSPNPGATCDPCRTTTAVRSELAATGPVTTGLLPLAPMLLGLGAVLVIATRRRVG